MKTLSRFHLEPPPGFRGLDPQKPVTFYQRNLPHWRQEGATYFVTFRLSDSLPREKLDILREMRNEKTRKLELLPDDGAEKNREKILESSTRAIVAKTERWLDQGMGSCLLRDSQTRSRLGEALEFFDTKRYELGSYVLMPNHAHLIIRPMIEAPRCKLEEILQDRKRASSFAINQATGGSGSIWQEESYDRIVRDAEHLWKTLQYIGRNPLKAGLSENEYTLWVCEEWIDAGWDFLDGESEAENK